MKIFLRVVAREKLGHYAKRNKPDTKIKISHDLMYIDSGVVMSWRQGWAGE